ncbi:uncharacterized protein F4822DRAFT_179769 [Hypoxylon trugodes]|uniref:uncharacterized protein n=1 Tax=Hypoxylon trugodes TaxID=326681 RepID=UPI00218D6B36|nr:uncharacterized protein F4822DRAFT_179769 [Hypoxylon trugodes]KAI1391257.1 hypothetical protein F4822DRAFT_179769 [Hypoxylon trugodes]
MHADQTPANGDSDWTFMYVLLGLIPIFFAVVAVYSVWRDGSVESQNDDLETARGYGFQQTWNPMNRNMARSERMGVSTTTSRGKTTPIKPPESSRDIENEASGIGRSMPGLDNIPLSI